MYLEGHGLNIVKKKGKEYAKDRKVCVYNYTLVDRKVIFVSYVYRVTAGEEEPEYYREEAQQILNNFRFNMKGRDI